MLLHQVSHILFALLQGFLQTGQLGFGILESKLTLFPSLFDAFFQTQALEGSKGDVTWVAWTQLEVSTPQHPWLGPVLPAVCMASLVLSGVSCGLASLQ